MSDERLRRLERRWKETGAAQDEAAFLLERVRVGEDLGWDSYSRLSQLNVQAATDVLLRRLESRSFRRERLSLAPFLAHEPARLNLGSDGPEPWDLLDPKRDWLNALDDWDRSALRLGLLTKPDEGRIRATIAVLNVTTRGDGMTKCQVAQVRAALRMAEAEVASPVHEFLDGALLYSIAEAGGEDVYSPARCLTKCFVDSEMGSGWPQSVASHLIDRLGLLTCPQAAQVIRQELVPWALDYSDPIRERVLLRQRLGAIDADNTVESRRWIQAEAILFVDPHPAVMPISRSSKNGGSCVLRADAEGAWNGKTLTPAVGLAVQTLRERTGHEQRAALPRSLDALGGGQGGAATVRRTRGGVPQPGSLRVSGARDDRDPRRRSVQRG